MDLPRIDIIYDPRHRDDKKPYIARVKGDGWYHAAEAASPSEALLLAAAHWHSRSHMMQEEVQE